MNEIAFAVVAASKFKNDEFPMGRRGMCVATIPVYFTKTGSCCAILPVGFTKTGSGSLRFRS